MRFLSSLFEQSYCLGRDSSFSSLQLFDGSWILLLSDELSLSLTHAEHSEHSETTPQGHQSTSVEQIAWSSREGMDRRHNWLELNVFLPSFYSLVEGVAEEEIRKPNSFNVKYLLETNEKRDALQVMIIFAVVNLFDFLFIVVGPRQRASSQKKK